MPKLYLVNKDSGRKFEILGIDKEAGQITLKGEMATFTEDYDKAKLKSLGYTLVQETPAEETEDAEQT